MTKELSSVLKEARTLLDAQYHCSNDTLNEAIRSWIKELLAPLVRQDNAEAIWLSGAAEDWRDLSDKECDQRHLERLQTGAAAEIPDAMCYLAHNHYEKGEYEPAAILYRKAADMGHAYAKWCHGLDLLSGIGVTQDKRAGLKLIEEAANLHFEGAIQFMANAYALGQHGYPKDEAVAASWQRKLGSKHLIRF